MNDGCAGCFQSAQGMKMALENVTKEAMEYAQKNKKSMAIFQENGEFKFIDAFFATANGIPITKVVSFHQSASLK